MGFGNRFVALILRSPLHRLLSGSTDLVRYRGRRSGRVVIMPTQYVREGDELIILVGTPRAKTWWRNFRTDHPLDVLVAGRWLPMTGRAVDGADHPGSVAPMLEVYLRRFPKAERTLPGDTPEERVSGAVIVWCQPRLAHIEKEHSIHLPKFTLPGTVPNEMEPG